MESYKSLKELLRNRSKEIKTYISSKYRVTTKFRVKQVYSKTFDQYLIMNDEPVNIIRVKTIIQEMFPKGSWNPIGTSYMYKINDIFPLYIDISNLKKKD